MHQGYRLGHCQAPPGPPCYVTSAPAGQMSRQPRDSAHPVSVEAVIDRPGPGLGAAGGVAGGAGLCPGGAWGRRLGHSAFCAHTGKHTCGLRHPEAGRSYGNMALKCLFLKYTQSGEMDQLTCIITSAT